MVSRATSSHTNSGGIMNRSMTGYLDIVALTCICTGLGTMFGWRVGVGMFLIFFGIGCALLYGDAKKEIKDDG